MPATKAGNADILVRGMREVFSTTYDEAESQIAGLFHVLSSQQDYEEFLQRVGFGYFPTEGEMELVQLQEAMLGLRTKITPVRFGLGYQVSKELSDDEKYGWIGSLSADLARALRATKEKHGADVFNNGFVTLGSDGKALFATDHPLRRGGIGSNRLATDSDLLYGSLQSAVTLLRGTTNDAGVPMGLGGTLKLIVAKEGEFQAAELIKSAGRPDTANRADNVLRQQRTWEIVVWDFLTDVDQFTIQAAARFHGLMFIDRMPYTTFEKVDDETYSVKHIARSRFKAGFRDWRGMVSTPGA